jgi:hypothetical protein
MSAAPPISMQAAWTLRNRHDRAGESGSSLIPGWRFADAAVLMAAVAVAVSGAGS